MCAPDTRIYLLLTPRLASPPHHTTPQKPQAGQGRILLRQAFEATGKMVRPYLAELEPGAEEDFIRWAQVEVASVEGVGKNSVRVAVGRRSMNEGGGLTDSSSYGSRSRNESTRPPRP